MSHDRSAHLAEALHNHVDSFRNLAEQLRYSVETGINTIGNGFWEHNAEKTEAITQLLERYTSGLSNRIHVLRDNVIDTYKEARSHRREVSDAFVLLRGLLQVYSNLFLYGTTAPIIDITSFSPPQSPVLAVRSYLRQLVSDYNAPSISLPEINTTGVRNFLWEREKLKPDSVSIQAIFSGKEGPLATKNAIVDAYLNDTRGIYNSLYQTLIRDYGEDIAPYPSSLIGTASRLLESEGVDRESPKAIVQQSDRLLYNQKKYFRTKLTFHEHVLSSYHEVHQSLENSLKVYNSSLFKNLHARTTLNDEHRLLKQALSFIHQGEYNDLSSAVSALESCINTATSELPHAILIDSPSFSAVSMLDARLQTQIRVLALIKKQISLHARFNILELERYIADVGKNLRQLNDQLRLGIPEAVQHLEDHLMVEVGVCTSMGNKDFPARRIVDALQKYRLDPDILLQEYSEVSLSVKAMEYYIKSLFAIIQPGDEDYKHIIHLLHVFDVHFDDSLKKLINIDAEYGTGDTDRCSIGGPEKRLEGQYKLLHDLSLLTAVSIASGSLLSSFQVFDKGVPIPGLKDITPGLFALTSHRRLPTSTLLQEADTIATALRPLIEPHGVLSHALRNASEVIQSAEEGTRILSASIFTDNRSARLADLSRAYEVRNKMRLEDMMGKIRRCFDVHNKAIVMLNQSTADLLGQKAQALPKSIRGLAASNSDMPSQELFGSIKNITLKNRQLNMQSELSTIEKFIKSRKRYSECLEELCQEGKMFTNLGDEIARIVESHSAVCDRSLELVKRSSEKYAEQIKDLWNEGVLKYDQLTQELYAEAAEDKMNFTDMKTFIDPCLSYSQFPPPQSLVSSICAPFIKDGSGESGSNGTEVNEEKEAETKTRAKAQKESTIAMRVPVLSPSGKNSIPNTLKVAKALDAVTKGSLFYGLEGIADGKMESVYVKLHFSLRYLEFSFEEGSFSLNLSNLTAVHAAPSTLTHGDNAYLCLTLLTPQAKYELYTRDRSALQSWVCSLRNILAYGKDIKSLRSLWIASSKENIKFS